MIFMVTSCSTGNTETEESANLQQEDQAISSDNQENGGTTLDNGGMAIIMNMNGRDVHATLNNTVIAQEFAKLLP